MDLKISQTVSSSCVIFNPSCLYDRLLTLPHTFLMIIFRKFKIDYLTISNFPRSRKRTPGGSSILVFFSPLNNEEFVKDVRAAL